MPSESTSTPSRSKSTAEKLAVYLVIVVFSCFWVQRSEKVGERGEAKGDGVIGPISRIGPIRGGMGADEPEGMEGVLVGGDGWWAVIRMGGFRLAVRRRNAGRGWRRSCSLGFGRGDKGEGCRCFCE